MSDVRQPRPARSSPGAGVLRLAGRRSSGPTEWSACGQQPKARNTRGSRKSKERPYVGTYASIRVCDVIYRAIDYFQVSTI